MEELKETSPDADPDRVFLYRATRQWFGTISAAGNDYVLIDIEGESKHRRVLAKSAIACSTSMLNHSNCDTRLQSTAAIPSNDPFLGVHSRM